MSRLVLILAAVVGVPALAVAQSTGEVVEYYHLDALGSVRAVTAQNGSVVRRHDFKPFGEEVNVTFPNPDRKLFTGHERDSETGFDYFGARYYRANVGRFTTVDPVQTTAENLVDPQRWNRYAYVRNNPLRYVDPDGRQIYMPMPSFLSKEALERNASIRAAILTVAAAGPNGDVGAAVLDALLLSTVLPATTSERDAVIVGSVFALAAPLEIPVGAKLGVAGGPGAGKAFRAWVKDAVREESPACVFCGEPTTLTPGPRQSNIDHAVPKSRLGNNTIENAQNTCRTCNLKKGNKTTSEFWEWLFGKSESQK